MNDASLKIRIACCLCWLACASLVSCAEPNGRILTVGSETFAGTFFQWREHELGFKMGDHQRSLPRSELLAWGAPRVAAPATTIVLHDGSVIVADVLEMTPREITFASRKRPGLWLENRIARSAIRAIIFSVSWNPVTREQVQRHLLEASISGEYALLSNGDTLRGAMTQARAVKEANGQESFRFDFQATGAENVTEIEQSRVAAIVFPAINARPKIQEAMWIGWTDGSCVRTVSLEEQAGKVVLHLLSGEKISAQAIDDSRTPPVVWSTRVCCLQRESPEFHYLSDLPTLGYKQIPLLDWQQTYSTDQMPNGAAVRVAGKKIIKAIYLPATSRLAYEIPDGMHTFHTQVALADAPSQTSSVVCRVFLETKPGEWKVQAEQTVSPGDDPRNMEVPLGTTKRLALVVDRISAGSDHAVWLNARLVP
jgi:hypothetical protein